MTHRLSTTHFNCGHPRSPENSSEQAAPRCKICRHRQQANRLTQFKCGHPVTEDNIRVHGKNKMYRRCRICDRERAAKVAERRAEKRAKKSPRPVLVLRFPWHPAPIRNESGRSYLLAPLREKQG